MALALVLCLRIESRAMMRLIFALPALLFAALTLSLTAQAQDNICTLKAENAPEVRGLKLGQTYEEVKKGLPLKAMVFDFVDELGVRRVDASTSLMSVRSMSDVPESFAKRFEGVNSVSLKFLDDKLASIEITYDSSIKWSNPLEFTAAIASNLKLPTTGWRGRVPTSLYCAGFVVETIGEIRTPQLTIKQIDLDGEIVTRKYETERKKREKFKP